MKIIQPSVEFLGAAPTDYADAITFIEKAGRTCYKSEDNITEGSAETFVKKLISAGHLAMVEHSNFVVKIPVVDAGYQLYTHWYLDKLKTTVGKFLNCWAPYNDVYIGGNLTAWYQALTETFGKHEVFWPFWGTYGQLFRVPPRTRGAFVPLRFRICPHEEIPKELHRYSARFICDRGVSHELVRHRLCSFAQESTRYVNYGGRDMEFIEPSGFGDWPANARDTLADSCLMSEVYYNALLDEGLKPQQARAVLPNALKTEVIVTADLKEWRHIFKLRCAPSAHPDFVRLAVDLRRQFEDAGVLAKTEN